MPETQEKPRFVSMHELPKAIDKIKDVYLELRALVKVTRNSPLVMGQGEIFEDYNFARIRIRLGDSIYSFREERDESEHRKGDGGEFGLYSFLKRDNENVLVSFLFNKYQVFTDDSDCRADERQETHILQEDPLARAVLQEMRKLNMKTDLCF